MAYAIYKISLLFEICKARDGTILYSEGKIWKDYVDQ